MTASAPMSAPIGSTISEPLADPGRYQTVYADQPGSVAAPTAGLHLTDRVLDGIRARGAAVHGVDLAVNMHGRGPESTRLLAATDPGCLVAFAHEEVDAALAAPVAWRADEHEVHRWCRLLVESGIHADPTDLRLPAPPADPPPTAAPPGRPLAVVHPGAAAPGRRHRDREPVRYARPTCRR